MASLSEGLHTCCASARSVGSLSFKGLLCSALFPRLVNLIFSARFLAGGVFAECCRFSFGVQHRDGRGIRFSFASRYADWSARLRASVSVAGLP